MARTAPFLAPHHGANAVAVQVVVAVSIVTHHQFAIASHDGRLREQSLGIEHEAVVARAGFAVGPFDMLFHCTRATVEAQVHVFITVGMSGVVHQIGIKQPDTRLLRRHVIDIGHQLVECRPRIAVVRHDCGITVLACLLPVITVGIIVHEDFPGIHRVVVAGSIVSVTLFLTQRLRIGRDLCCYRCRHPNDCRYGNDKAFFHLLIGDGVNTAKVIIFLEAMNQTEPKHAYPRCFVV